MPDLLPHKVDQYDLRTLLQTLEAKGFAFEKLVFEGTNTCHSYTSLCEKVVQNPYSSKVLVTMNLGLLVGTSPLPSYYRKGMEQGEIDDEGFIHFLQFFNHHLIKAYLKSCWPEKFLTQKLSHTSVPSYKGEKQTAGWLQSWQELKRSNLMLLGLDSVSSMHWVFSLCFPELEISVKKCVKEQKITCPEFYIGASHLGERCALGGYIRQSLQAYSVTLRSEIEQTDLRVFWPTEIRSRLKEMIFPLINKTHIYLILSFTINQYHRATYLNKLSSVGFTSLGEATSNFTWLLFEGYGTEKEVVASIT